MGTDAPTPTEMPAELNCPTCGKPVATDPPDRPASFPFCRPRCKLIDLGRWLSGEYRIAGPQRPTDPGRHDVGQGESGDE